MPKITSDFALLDVKDGRKVLEKHLRLNPDDRIPVTIDGFITERWGNEDGTSIEFVVQVSKLKVGEF